MIVPLHALLIPMALQTREPSWFFTDIAEPTFIGDIVSETPVAIFDEGVNEAQTKAFSLDPDGNTTPAAKERLEGKLISYLELEHDWDGYGGKPPTTQAVVDALTWLRSISPDCSLPKPMLSGSGEVGLYWDAGGYYCDIGFDGDRTFSYYSESPNGNVMSDEDVNVEEIPETLTAFLESISVN